MTKKELQKDQRPHKLGIRERVLAETGAIVSTKHIALVGPGKPVKADRLQALNNIPDIGGFDIPGDSRRTGINKNT